MAKRYTEFAHIPEGHYKPGGTLGSHHCTVVFQGDKKVIIGSATGRVTLSPGDTLGYDCGTVWIVPRPESYKDPIRRVMAKAHLSQKFLVYSTEPIEYTWSVQDTSSWPTNSAADPATGEEVHVLGQHQNMEVEFGDGWACRLVTDGDAVIVRQVVGRDTKLCRPRRVTRVVVRPNADKRKVVAWLEEIFDVGAAREQRLKALEEKRKPFLYDLEIAKKLWKQICSYANFESAEAAIEKIHSIFLGTITTARKTEKMEDILNPFWGLKKKAPSNLWQQIAKAACLFELDDKANLIVTKTWWKKVGHENMFPMLFDKNKDSLITKKIEDQVGIDFINFDENLQRWELLVKLHRCGVLQQWLEYLKNQE